MQLIDVDKWQEIYHVLRANKLRTFLTAFGVFWGIFMLIIMLGAGNGLRHGVTDGFGDFATNSAFFWSQSTTMPYKGFRRGRPIELSNADMDALRRNIPGLDLLAPRLQGWGSESNNVTYGNKAGAFTINGDYPEFNKIDPQKMVAGRFVNWADIADKRKVAVIGNEVRDVLFGADADPIGKYIKIKGVYWQVVGLFKPGSGGISFGGDKAKTIFLPFTSLQQAYNFGDIIHYFSFTAQKGVPVSQVEDNVLRYLKERKKVHPDDDRAFGHFNIEKEYKQMSGLFMGINGLIWIVGIGTLVAGVIGVSNIMLIVVKERTREIGVRRALGATPRNLISQILTESVFLTAVAGYIGLSLGVLVLSAISNALAKPGTEEQMFKNPEVSFHIAIVALVVLIVSGLLAGLIPARRALRIRPVEALRAE